MERDVNLHGTSLAYLGLAQFPPTAVCCFHHLSARPLLFVTAGHYALISTYLGRAPTAFSSQIECRTSGDRSKQVLPRNRYPPAMAPMLQGQPSPLQLLHLINFKKDIR